MPERIEDYALLGDRRSAALVARDGSVDWLCWPRFDSEACFAALLGGPEHGRWRIAPVDGASCARRRYRGDTLILETDFESPGGGATLVDAMLLGADSPTLVRTVIGARGRVRLRSELAPRFGYGRVAPAVRRLDDGAILAAAGAEAVVLRGDPSTSAGQVVPARVGGGTITSDFAVAAGERVSFVLTHGTPPTTVDAAAALDDTERAWRAWAARCTYAGPWRDAVVRSLLTLEALTYAPTGGSVAAPTTSLPQILGGTRNWDYRYCWLRDATLTLVSLMGGGYRDEAAAWRDWLVRAVGGDPTRARIMYGVAGETALGERTIPWLPGYEGASPVRVGNAAHAQLQLDVYGEVLSALHQARAAGLGERTEAWSLECALVGHLETVWQAPDAGIWEVRGEPRHFTHSKVMAWVAVDRAVRSAERFGLACPLERWRELRARIHDDVCRRAYDAEGGVFVQAYGSRYVDASVLLLPLVGFLPPGDPRVRRTVRRIEERLAVGDGLLLRYEPEALPDAPPGEDAFAACGFWLVAALALTGRRADARALFERLLALRNDVGLLAEGYDVVARRQVGNFPQGFSHVGLVDAALLLAAGDAG